jgi:hypothetical protein
MLRISSAFLCFGEQRRDYVRHTIAMHAQEQVYAARLLSAKESIY